MSAPANRAAGAPRRPALRVAPKPAAKCQATTRHRRRINGIFVVLVLTFSVVAVRLVYLQGLRATELRALASRQRASKATLPAVRGSIYDRNMAPLALSVQRSTIAADPGVITEPLLVAQRLAPVLHEEVGAVLPRLQGDGAFSYVARAVDDSVAQQVRAMSLPGIFIVPETRRSYPSGSLAAAVLGVSGVDGTGLEGIEYRYDDLLRGRPGRVEEERDPEGRPIPQAPSTVEPSVPGSSLVLTLDEELQYQVEQMLEAGVKEYKAKGGTVVVMDSRTGEILAMANSPGFRPGDFAATSYADRRNRTITDVFEPGSTNKVVTMAAALEEGRVSTTEHIDVPDRMKVAGEVYQDAEEHELASMTMEDILVESSNVGTIKVAQRVGIETLDRYFNAFGYWHKTALDFSDEAEGLLTEASGASIATVPIGQGIAVTPLQITLVYAALANDGVQPVPSLVARVVGPDHKTRLLPPPTIPRRIVSPATAATLRRMLTQVVDRGTGANAAVEGYAVAGKTGTARIPGPEGYTDKYVASFVGFAPAANPSIVISVSLDQPSQPSFFGGDTAAPLFSQIARYALRHLKIPPTGSSKTRPEGKPDLGEGA